MANLKSVFPPEYLRGDDLDGPVVVTIASADLDEESEYGPQVVLTFVEPGYGKFYLNKTNRKAAQKAFGAETDEWVGKSVKLTPAQVRNPTTGAMVTGIVLIAQ